MRTEDMYYTASELGWPEGTVEEHLERAALYGVVPVTIADMRSLTRPEFHAKIERTVAEAFSKNLMQAVGVRRTWDDHGIEQPGQTLYLVTVLGYMVTLRAQGAQVEFAPEEEEVMAQVVAEADALIAKSKGA